MQTVKENEVGFTKRELLGAKLAAKAMRIVGHPSVRDLQTVVEQNLSHENPTTVRDMQIAQKGCGPSTAMLKGKTRRTTPAEAKTNVIPISRRNKTREMAQQIACPHATRNGKTNKN